ncbi:MAG: glycosyltransferase [Bacteroidales bacterium]|nr:glycosyltransferase [Bacteroidales bacterium]
MKKVLIISSPFFDYQISVGKAFKALGYDVRIEIYDEPIHPFKGLLKWKHKFAKDKEKLRAQSRSKYDAYIKQVYDEYQPDIVFSYNGTILLDERLDYFRQKSKVLLWMYDSVQRPDRARCEKHIDHADAVFCFEERDVDYYARQGKTAYFLPLACDTDVYYSIENQDKDIDLLFVATIYTSKKRMQLIQSVVNHFPDKNIVIYGWYKPFVKNPFKWLFREKRNVFKNVNIPPAKVNELFSRTKIALNIHHEQTFHGANQRVFEASGAGAYQVCDANPYIESLFPNGEVGLYCNEQEMIEQIRWALDPANENERERRAKAAQEIILKGNTFLSRVKQMLEVAGIA